MLSFVGVCNFEIELVRFVFGELPASIRCFNVEGFDRTTLLGLPFFAIDGRCFGLEWLDRTFFHGCTTFAIDGSCHDVGNIH